MESALSTPATDGPATITAEDPPAPTAPAGSVSDHPTGLHWAIIYRVAQIGIAVALTGLFQSLFAQPTNGHALMEWVLLAMVVTAGMSGAARLAVRVRAARSARALLPGGLSQTLIDWLAVLAGLLWMAGALLGSLWTTASYGHPEGPLNQVATCSRCPVTHAGGATGSAFVAFVLGVAAVTTIAWLVCAAALHSERAAQAAEDAHRNRDDSAPVPEVTNPGDEDTTDLPDEPTPAPTPDRDHGDADPTDVDPTDTGPTDTGPTDTGPTDTDTS
jgi:hypothetical protein